ncbi:hypothetical protein T05_13135 [Trichinella murrelli]|uniref:Uncharacterized protein n=1 Tax=Trichinella murrelli TaxID=144512 RepID=A0A0V0TWS1_9BILA|nr:hypothetical protein T05_13135 [Trichinella murrelli]
MDKVHQFAPGSSNTSERTDLVTRPRAVWSLADRAIPSREQNSSTILPNGARLRGMFGSIDQLIGFAVSRSELRA